MLTLYFNPGSCSLAAHAALEEAGLVYDLARVDLGKDDQNSAGYRAINSWGKVPALGLGDAVLTENIAILSYIAERVPERDLLPVSGLERARAFEWLALLSSTVHVAFRPIFRPGRLASTEAGREDVAATGLAALRTVLDLLDDRLADGPYALGERFSLCDLYLFVFVLWSRRPMLAGQLGALPRLAAFGDRLAVRPSMAAALAQEGLSWPARASAPTK